MKKIYLYSKTGNLIKQLLNSNIIITRDDESNIFIIQNISFKLQSILSDYTRFSSFKFQKLIGDYQPGNVVMLKSIKLVPLTTG